MMHDVLEIEKLGGDTKDKTDHAYLRVSSTMGVFHLLVSFILIVCDSSLHTVATEESYRVLGCHQNSVLPQCQSKFPQLCNHNSDCVFHKLGIFLPSSDAFDHSSTNQSCSEFAHTEPSCDSFAKGEFIHGLWKRKRCKLYHPDSRLFRNHLTGRRILMSGNSIIRQVFTRLVWHARDIPEIIEHYFHDDAYYAFNGTHDYLGVRETYDEKSCMIQNPLFVAEYLWSDGDEFYQYIDRSTKFDLTVVGYSYYPLNDTQLINDMEHATSKLGNSILFLTMPMVDWKVTPKKNEGDLRVINKWIETNNKFHLPLNEMAETNVFGKNPADNVHFQCGFLMNFEEPVASKVKMPANGDCSDKINLNMAFLMTRYVRSLPCRNHEW